MNYTYLLRCADGTLYCGWTNHLAARVAAHNAGKGAKYTRTRRPVVLAYYEEYATRSDAPGGSDQETDQKGKRGDGSAGTDGASGG